MRTDAENMMPMLNTLIKKIKKNKKVLVIIDDCSSEKDLDKHRTAISKIAFSGRHNNIKTWFLSQGFISVPKDFRENAVWCLCMSKSSFTQMVDNYDLFTPEYTCKVKESLRKKEDKLLIIDTNWWLINDL